MFFAVLCVWWEPVANLPNDLALSTWLCPLEELLNRPQFKSADVFPEGAGIPPVACVVLCNIFIYTVGMMDVDGQVNVDGWLKPGLGWHGSTVSVSR